MPIEELKRPEGINEDRIEKLKELFPEAFGDEKLNIEILKEQLIGLNEDLIEENIEEFYGLQWVGKKDARKLATLPANGTLRKAEGEGVSESDTKNLFIEGDNLEILRILQKSYAGRIKTIYIDPPYNTGNDYIYKDDFKEPVEKYLQKTSQADEEGLLTSNPKASGRYHANWLSMMYPRLKLAWNLLESDGVICISISDIEEANLRLVMDEIFGEENHINTVSIKSKVSAGASGGGEDKRLKKNIEYILIYAKNISELGSLAHLSQHTELIKLIEEMREEGKSWKYTNIFIDWGERERVTTITDGDGNPIEIYKRKNVKRSTVSRIMREEGLSEEEVYRKYLNSIFRDTNAQSSIRQRVIDAVPALSNDEVYEIEYVPRSGKNKGKKFVQTYVGNIQLVVWLRDVVEEKDGVLMKLEKLGTLWDDVDFNNVGREGGIPYPNGKKPIELIKRCIKLNDDGKGIVLDFFAGSGSTGHAVLDMNFEDNGNRQFILVQLPEVANGTDFEKISDLSKQRLKNSIVQLNEQDKNENQLDRGFAVFKMNKSNIRKWESFQGESLDILNQKLDLFTSTPFIDEAKDIDIVFELMLSQGFPLDSNVKLIEKSSNSLWIAQHEDVPFSLIVCLDEKLQAETGRFLNDEYEKGTFICLDNALSNEQKILLSESMNVKTI